jgi:hypothetical protein
MQTGERGERRTHLERRCKRLEVGYLFVRLSHTGFLFEAPDGEVALGLREDTGVVRVFGLDSSA